VAVRVRAGGAESPTQPFRFTVSGRDGAFVLEADVSPAELAAARARWRAMTEPRCWALRRTLLLCAGPLMDRRRQTRELSAFSR
jgi:hypothetical protein